MLIFGINTAFRASDILGLNVGDVRGLEVGDRLVIKEQKTFKKTRKARAVLLNADVIEALQGLLAVETYESDDEPLFKGYIGRKGERRFTRLTVATLGRMVKKWCENAGCPEGNYASHTLRKTFAYMNRKNGADILLIQSALGHASPATTLRYMCVMPDELSTLYMKGI